MSVGRFELPTNGLKGHCSAIELHALNSAFIVARPYHSDWLIDVSNFPQPPCPIICWWGLLLAAEKHCFLPLLPYWKPALLMLCSHWDRTYVLSSCTPTLKGALILSSGTNALKLSSNRSYQRGTSLIGVRQAEAVFYSFRFVFFGTNAVMQSSRVMRFWGIVVKQKWDHFVTIPALLSLRLMAPYTALFPKKGTLQFITAQTVAMINLFLIPNYQKTNS